MSSLAGKKTIVTGGAGFIGSNLVDALVNQDAKVTVLDDLSSGSRENLNPKATFVLGGLEDRKVVLKIIDDVDLVYHLAADTATRETSMGWNDPTRVLERDIVGTLNLFQAIEGAGGEVYNVSGQNPVTIQHPVELILAQLDLTGKIDVLHRQIMERRYPQHDRRHFKNQETRIST